MCVIVTEYHKLFLYID